MGESGSKMQDLIPASKAHTIDDILHKYTSKAGESPQKVLGAAFAVLKTNGELLYMKEAGQADFGEGSPPFTGRSLCWIASMTKLMVVVSIMQLVEQGKVGLDSDAGEYVPELADVKVLDGFDDEGQPILTARTKPVTLRNLLTHSSGFCYDGFDPDMIRYNTATNRTDNANNRDRAGFTFPLKFQPGSGWTYGVGIDWAGLIVEAVTQQKLEDYMHEHIWSPANMTSTSFYPNKLSQQEKATMTMRADPTSPLTPGEAPITDDNEVNSGGSGLWSTAQDYVNFMTALLQGKLFKKPESTMQQMWTPQIDDDSHLMGVFDSFFHDFFCPEYPIGLAANYALAGAVNMEDLPGKRKKGSVMWSGMPNLHWWIDPTSEIAGIFFTQVLPPGDPMIKELFDDLERAVYKGIEV